MKLTNALCFLAVAATSWLGLVGGMWSWSGFVPGGRALLSLLVPLVPALWLGALVTRWRRGRDSSHLEWPQVVLFMALLVMVAPMCLVMVFRGGPLPYGTTLMLHTNARMPYFDTTMRSAAGAAMAWMGDEADIPPGYLVADGRSLAKAEQEALYQCYGSTFGADGDTFNLPDYRGMYLLDEPILDTTLVIAGGVSVGEIPEARRESLEEAGFGKREIHWLIWPGD